MPPVVVSSEEVDRTITAFTRLDQRGDKKAMNKLAGRLQREQPHLLQYAAAIRNDHGDKAGEAAVFYATLVWAMWPKPVPVEVATVGRGPLIVTVDEDGRARVEDRYLVTAPLAGTVVQPFTPFSMLSKNTVVSSWPTAHTPGALRVRKLKTAELPPVPQVLVERTRQKHSVPNASSPGGVCAVVAVDGVLVNTMFANAASVATSAT